MKLYKHLVAISLLLIFCSQVVFGKNISAENRLKRIGVQLYTVRKEMEKDFAGTLKRVAEIGFDEVEFVGLFGQNPKNVRKMVEKLGMKIISSHINWEKFKNNPQEAIEETKSLGAKYMVLAWFPPQERQTISQWKEWAKRLNQVGKMAHDKGIRLLYHNHDFEFKKVDGVEPFEIILAETDRRYVSIEIDLYWLELGGGDWKTYFAKYPGEFELGHVKDMSKTNKEMVDVGDGRIDFASIFAQSNKSGMKHIFVEHDNTKDPFVTLERSLKYLRELRF